MTKADHWHGPLDGRRYKPLSSSMDNVIASRLGRIARQAGVTDSAGDDIDRGLILLRLLGEAGLELWIAGDARRTDR